MTTSCLPTFKAVIDAIPTIKVTTSLLGVYSLLFCVNPASVWVHRVGNKDIRPMTGITHLALTLYNQGTRWGRGKKIADGASSGDGHHVLDPSRCHPY